MSYYSSDYYAAAIEAFISGASTTCNACGSSELNCCNGDGRRYTHRIINEDGQFVSGFYSADEALEALLKIICSFKISVVKDKKKPLTGE